MFWFCKPKPIDVYFYTTREEVFTHAKPQKAIDFVPEWFKKQPKADFLRVTDAPLKRVKNIKTCPGFINLYRSGFVFSLWSDVNIQIDPDGAYKYNFADGQSFIQTHSFVQFAGSSFEQSYVELKFINPWVWETTEKINFLFSAPTWNGFGYENAVVAPGVYSPHTSPIEANVNLFFKRQTEPVIYELNFGQPLVHMVPLSERPLKLHYRLVTDAELKRIKNKSPISLMFRNRSVRAEKLCPHA